MPCIHYAGLKSDWLLCKQTCTGCPELPYSETLSEPLQAFSEENDATKNKKNSAALKWPSKSE